VRACSAITPDLEIHYRETGAPDGLPVILLHGFPDDATSYDRCAEQIGAAGHRAIAPYLRGYAPTRFLRSEAPRRGQQAAFAQDLLAFMDVLEINRAALVGYDWGGRAACNVAALFPERVHSLVSVCGYNMLNMWAGPAPLPPEQERRFWYQWYFATERGRAGLTANRTALCRLLWDDWSPGWRFSAGEYEALARSFDNPDFVPVVIDCYRSRFDPGLCAPEYRDLEMRLSRMPRISVPTLVLHGAEDGCAPPHYSDSAARHFTGPYRRELMLRTGHFPARESPELFATLILDHIATCMTGIA
jgi:pimeloyl-ACP methyl ester carboxylesterase